jgi:hypothetical protein
MNRSVGGWVLAMALSWTVEGTELDLDCARPEQARKVVGRLMLSEIEGAEDIQRAAMWEAFGRCPTGGGGGPCRERARQRFEAQWERQKKEIEDKYLKMLSDFEQRCRAAVTRARPDAGGPPSG